MPDEQSEAALTAAFRQTVPSGGSVRDLALLVGLSHQSVHLLMRKAGEERRAGKENGSFSLEAEFDGGDGANRRPR
jgi:hypothetical protein